jgi:hypothetical protein
MSGADPATAAVERLRRVQAALADGRLPELGAYFASPDRLDLDRALGLHCRPGGTPGWRRAAERERDELLRALASGDYDSDHARAVALQQRLRRYAASSWPRDRVTKQPTAANEVVYRIYVLDADPPTGISRLKEILAQ